MYGLVDPNNNVVKIELDIKPVDTKPGWRWMKIQQRPKPKFNKITHELCEPTYDIDRDTLYQVWSIKSRSLEEIEQIKDDIIDDINPAVLMVLFSLYKEKSPNLTIETFKKKLKSII